jgi:guanosine-3',5'-bis(diphosphate) 3'-pyrophosphohydrolase
VLAHEAGITDTATLCAGFLHDTIEDTQTSPDEPERKLGREIRSLVEEVTDDKELSKAERKRLQVERGTHASDKAKLVKLADKICNLRDIANAPPAKWDLSRKREYFDWARSVVDQLRGANEKLEALFDEAYKMPPEG